MLREAAQSVRKLLDGETVRFADYPAVASYFNLKPETPFRLTFRPRTPIRLYCGGNGPRALAIGGKSVDGIIFGGTFQAVARMGHLERLMHIADDAATQSARPPLRKSSRDQTFSRE